MRVKLSYKDKGLNKILREFAKAHSAGIKVGVVGPKAGELSDNGRYTNAEVAVVNEFGSDDGHVPARSFLRSTFRNRPKETADLLKVAALGVIHNTPIAQSFDSIGKKLAEMVKQTIHDGTADGRKHNAPSTIAKKGFDHPLVATGGLAEAISHQVVHRSGDVLDAGASDSEFESFSVTTGGGE